MNITDTFLNGLIAQVGALTIQAKQKARYCLLDYLGVVVGGANYLQNHHPELFKTFMEDEGAYSVFGTRVSTALTNAAFLNGFSAHVLELDDGHRHGMIHLGASIVSAILAAAEKNKLPYNSVLCGIVMGYEAAVRCSRAIQPGHKVRGYHVSGTCGTIGSAIGVACACGFNKEQLKATLDCAVSSAAGVLEIQEEASEMKPYNIGRAAMDGVLAAQMGALAIPGPDDVLGGKRGFLSVLTDTPHVEMLTDFSFKDYAIEGIYQKVHAACRHCHPAIDAILDIRNDIDLKPDQVEKITVRTYKLAVGSHDHTQIRGISSAKLSTPFSVALAIVNGSAGYSDYNEASLEDHRISDLTYKVNVIEDDDFTQISPTVRGAKVTLYLKNGKEYESSCIYPKGEPENPLTNEELESKYYSMCRYADFPKNSARKVADIVINDNGTLLVSDLVKEFCF